MFCTGICVHSHLKAVIEEEEGDMFSTVTWLVSQGDGLHSVNQAAMGWQQVGLQRKQKTHIESSLDKLKWIPFSHYLQLSPLL